MNATAAKILLSGASGLIGRALRPRLEERGYQVTTLVRSPSAGPGQVAWDPARPLAPQSVSGFAAVIHLAGESVAGHWSGPRKRRIRDSRVEGTRHLAEAVAQAPERPRVLMSASAVGYYGDRGEEGLNEDSSPGGGFLAEVCREWEAAVQPAEAAGIRSVRMRLSLVLSPAGGALHKMLTPFRLGLGGNVGSGRQWWSWMDVQDLMGAIDHVLSHESLRGAVNMVAPNPVRNSEFTRTLASVLGRPAIFPLPAFAARLVFGEMADQLLLASQRVEPAKLLASGYRFQHAELRAALEGMLRP